MKKRKICVITGSRAEYGLLYWLMKEIEACDDLELQLIVTGMHLSPEFGLTFQEIEKEFNINKKIEILLSSDTPISISKSMGLAQISFAECFEDIKPNLIVVLGDRYEIFSAVCVAMIQRIPVAHIHGGAFDELIRHSITKMSHLHFTSTEEYRRRVIQLGERPEYVYNVGAIGGDNITKLQLLSKNEFEKSINLTLNNRNLLITFHPTTLENDTAEEQFLSLLKVLDEQKDTCFIFTKANSDTGGRIINKLIDNYVKEHSDKSISFTSMGQIRYLSAMKFVDACIGNSSSGIIETPFFKLGTINIGDRQKGRIKSDNIIDCKANYTSIKMAFKYIYSKKFQSQLCKTRNVYGGGTTSKQIVTTLKNISLDGIIHKEFYDLKEIS